MASRFYGLSLKIYLVSKSWLIQGWSVPGEISIHAHDREPRLQRRGSWLQSAEALPMPGTWAADTITLERLDTLSAKGTSCIARFTTSETAVRKSL